jgi:hypothetical protein
MMLVERENPNGLGSAPVPEGAQLHSGDRLRLTVEVTTRAFLYVAQETANNTLSLLVPTDGGQIIALPGGSFRLPKWFQPGQKEGEETLFLVASTRPIDPTSVTQLIKNGADTKTRDSRSILIDKNREITPSAPAETVRPITSLLPSGGATVLPFRYLHD